MRSRLLGINCNISKVSRSAKRDLANRTLNDLQRIVHNNLTPNWSKSALHR